MRFPLVIIYAIIAFNFSMFSLMMQVDALDVAVFHSPIAKAIAWLLTLGVWVLAYVNRAKSIRIF